MVIYRSKNKYRQDFHIYMHRKANIKFDGFCIGTSGLNKRNNQNLRTNCCSV
jgi:hypothetical protein